MSDTIEAKLADRRLDYRYCPACGAWRFFEIIRAGRAGAVCDGCVTRAALLAKGMK